MRFELKPLSFGEVIDGAFKILRGNLALFVLTALVFELPAMWGTARMQAAQAQMQAARTHLVAARPSLPSGFFLIGLLMMAAYFVMWGTMTAATIQIISGEQTSFGKAFQRFRAFLGRALGTSVIVLIVTMLYSLLLVVPGIVYALRRSLFLPVMLVEGTSGPRSVERSRALVKGGGGRMGRIFLTNLLIVVLGWSFNWGLGLLIPASLRGTFVGAFVTMLPQVIITPVYVIALVLIYYDARVRDEGYDLELRAKDVAAAAPGPA
ncbi:MAG TPA: hypothetical protein VFH68_25855 [Polyangia bacterium]|jgi:hypothetical protein|nr:hypothetical protein [Polyangia bacterium]